MQFQRLVDYIEYMDRDTIKFCWRWFAIFTRTLQIAPALLERDELRAVQRLLVQYQKTIQHTLTMKPFIDGVRCILDRNVELASNAETVETAETNAGPEYWHEIMETAKKHAVIDKLQEDNLRLISVFVAHKFIHSHAFVEDIIGEIVERCNIKKSNHSIGLLITIMRNVNMDLLTSARSIKVNVIKWLSSKVRTTDLKKVIGNDCSMQTSLIAELYVLCILSRSTEEPAKNVPPNRFNSDQCDHQRIIDDLKETLQYRVMSNLIVSDSLEINDQKCDMADATLPDGNAVQAIIDEGINNELETSLGMDDSIESSSHSSDQFNDVAKSLAIYAHILNVCVRQRSMTVDHFEKSNLKKRVGIKSQQLNNIVGQMHGRSNEHDASEMIDQMLDIWHESYHPVVAQVIYDLPLLQHIIGWLTKQMVPIRRQNSRFMVPLHDASHLEFDERFQLKCLTLTTYFAAYETDDSDELDIFQAIEGYSLNYARNEDVFIAFEIAKIIICQTQSSERRVNWAFGVIKSMCEELNVYPSYMELVAEIIPDLIRCLKPYPDTFTDLLHLIAPFLKHCNAKRYGQRICVKIIVAVQYLAQQYYDDETSFQCIAYLNKFINSDYLAIQFVTVQALSKMFNKQWLMQGRDQSDCLEMQEFHVKLLESLKLDKLSYDANDEIDRKACVFAARLQLYCSIFGTCYALRKQIWFRMVEFCCHELQLKADKVGRVMGRLCKTILNGEPSDVLGYLSSELIEFWIEHNYHLSELPWYLTKCVSNEEYIADNIQHITWNVLQFHPKHLEKVVEMIYANSVADILQPAILVKALAFVTTINVTDNPELKTLKSRAINVLQTIRTYQPKIEDYFQTYPLEIVEELLNSTWDQAKFHQLFDVHVEHAGGYVIDLATFLKALESAQKKSSIHHVDIIEYFCLNTPTKIVNISLSLKAAVQNSGCDELKLCHLFRLCIWINFIADYMTENVENSSQAHTIAFFVRDIVAFFCNTIHAERSTKLKLATAEYFQKFCRKILPACAKHFQAHLNSVVSVLMALNKPDAEHTMVMDFLRFLVIDQQQELHSAIGLLDGFPTDADFDELRDVQNDAKYQDRVFSLREEIEWFLSLQTHKIEGLLSLRDHLSAKKAELEEIYANVYNSRGFSEDCDESLIHRLIFMLLEIVRGPEEDKSVVAAKCLGELGPNDLGSIVLKFNEQKSTYQIYRSLNDAFTGLCSLALEELDGLCMHTDVDVLAAVRTASSSLLRTKMGLEASAAYPLLQVFKGSDAELSTSPFAYAGGELNLTKCITDEMMTMTHSTWVTNVASDLFKLFGGGYLAIVAAKETTFAEKMIPLLIKALLRTNNQTYFNQLATFVNTYFAKHFEHRADDIEYNKLVTLPVYLNKNTIKSMLSIVECIRLHNLSLQTKRTIATEQMIGLNYLHVAKAAAFCEAQFTSILYGELAIYKSENHTNADATEILRRSYKAIGETDAVTAYLDPIKSRLEYLRFNQNYMDVFLQYDAQANCAPSYVECMAEAGLMNLANRFAQTDSKVPNYEYAWRLGDWSHVDGADEVPTIQNTQNISRFDKHHYFALKCVERKEFMVAQAHIRQATDEIVKIFKQSSFEVTNNIYQSLMQLSMLQQIDEFASAQLSNQEASFKFIVDKWAHQDNIQANDFKYREPIRAQRIALIRVAGIRAKRKIDSILKADGLQRMMLDLIGDCREEGYYNSCTRYLLMLQQLTLSKEMQVRISRISWNFLRNFEVFSEEIS